MVIRIMIGRHSMAFARFFKTQAERAMKSLNVEILMGHDIGLADSYYKPSEQELLADYIKSVDLLTIENDRFKLERQVKELNEKSKDENYIIKGKLSEKDREIAVLHTDIASLKEEIRFIRQIFENNMT